MQLVGALGGIETLRPYLLTTPFEAWHGLLAEPRFTGPLGRGCSPAAAGAVCPSSPPSSSSADATSPEAEHASNHHHRSSRSPPSSPSAAPSSPPAARKLGHPGPPRAVAAAPSPTCTSTRRGSRAAQRHPRFAPRQGDVRQARRREPDVGAGGDWNCLMSWTDPNVPMPAEGYGKFELNVHSNDCYTAGGPSKLTGFLTMTDTRGREVTNPVFEFDGCFDPNGDNTPPASCSPRCSTSPAPTSRPTPREGSACRSPADPGTRAAPARSRQLPGRTTWFHDLRPAGGVDSHRAHPDRCAQRRAAGHLPDTTHHRCRAPRIGVTPGPVGGSSPGGLVDSPARQSRPPPGPERAFAGRTDHSSGSHQARIRRAHWPSHRRVETQRPRPTGSCQEQLDPRGSLYGAEMR